MPSEAPSSVPSVMPARAASSRSALKWVIMLGALACLPALTVDMYLPALPQVASDLGTSDALAQLTVSCMLVGGALGQLVIGPLTDRFGRRLPLMIGLGMHVLVSLACAVVDDIHLLIGLRLAQGFFNSAASVAAMATVRDRFVGAEAARILSRLMLVIGVAPMLAPSLGSIVLEAFEWRWIFVVLALIGATLAVIVFFVMPETNPVARRTTGGASSVVRGYRTLLRDKHFMALALIPGLAMGALLSYVVGSPFVFQQGYGLTHGQFSLLFAVNGLGLVLSAQVNAALVRRVAPIRLLRTALVAQLVLSLVLLAVAITEFGGLIGLLVALWLVLAFQGLIPANASALAMSRHGEIAGTSAAMIGAIQSLLAGIVSPIVGLLGSDTVAMSSVMLGAGLAAFVVLATATPAYRKGGWHAPI
ncbi:multidrug effflux MFS transporter [Promicromonospora sp. NPDC060271]|uniref:multidrug effflux MFS transporter n=1 Tax=Promicromonospora sp. NPDC060271 TaxID=3347089 RepID=UPI00366915DF